MKLLLYCTKAKPYLVPIPENEEALKEDKLFSLIPRKTYENYLLCSLNVNGKIVAECDYEVEKIYQIYGRNHPIFDENGLFDDYIDYVTDNLNEKELLKQSCLNLEEIEKYNPKHAIHIKNLHIFGSPRELSEYGMDFPISPIVKAPQNMMYANGIGGRYILISIRPEWLCKILNKEKTIEVRKKVLKEMLKNE